MHRNTSSRVNLALYLRRLNARGERGNGGEKAISRKEQADLPTAVSEMWTPDVVHEGRKT
jgi:hypothetical protein